MEKRTLIAIVLSIVVLYAYSFLVPATKEQPKLPATTVAPVAEQGAKAPVAISANLPDTKIGLTVPVGMSRTESLVTVDTDLYTAQFSTIGGVLKDFRLKKYREKSDAGSPGVSVFSAVSPEQVSLATEGKELGIDANLKYSVATEKMSVSGANTAQLDFMGVTASGLSIRKTYHFVGNDYAFNVSHALSNAASTKITGPLQLLLRNKTFQDKGDGRYEVQEAVVFSGGKTTHLAQKDAVKEAKAYVAGAQWTTYGDKYFMSAVIAQDKTSLGTIEIRDLNGIITNRIGIGAVALEPGQSVTFTEKLFIGPKDIDILKAQGGQLEEVIDLGWFSAIAKPFLFTLKFFYKYVGNYGLAIIIITVILKALFYPLTHKSYKSMKGMQKLQPQMEKLKEKHKGDRNALNQEVMKLYQEHKVNPLGGCLPMVVQIPVFFALYKALMFSIELRHAPFYFWITDLSAKDPYYVTPLIMGATMFIQQKMTPTSMDPMQAKIMLLMPVIFTFMFLSFPSGLVLYWLVNNVLSISQQYYINKSVAV